jgi:hypothetical protein
MKTVSRFEANLLRILHFFLRRVPPEQALPLVLKRSPAPRCLSRAAVELVQDALAKGCTLLLARAGGWRRERFLRGGQPVEGRLWERTPPEELRLTFSRHTLRLLIRVTAAQPGDPEPAWSPRPSELTVGDRFLLFLAYQALRTSPAGPDLRKVDAFVRHGLCRLAYPEDFTQASVNARPDFAPWTDGPGACILEVWQSGLAACWFHTEGCKGQIADWQRLRAVGQAQEQVLGIFLDAVEAAGRRDLARFLFPVAARLLTADATAQTWVGGLSAPGPRLADRTATYRAALVVLRQLDRLRQWYQQARGVGYFDEGYAASQLWKASWEHYDGDTLRARAQGIIRAVEPLSI